MNKEEKKFVQQNCERQRTNLDDLCRMVGAFQELAMTDTADRLSDIAMKLSHEVKALKVYFKVDE